MGSGAILAARATAAPPAGASVEVAPTEGARDLSVITRPRMVMRGGAIYDPAETHRKLGIAPFAPPHRATPPTAKGEEEHAPEGAHAFAADGRGAFD